MTTASAVEPLCLPPRPLTRAPMPRVPEGSVDCHFHVFARGVRLAPTHSYTPQPASLEDWLRLASTIAARYQDDTWLTVRPPLMRLSDAALYDLYAEAAIEALNASSDCLSAAAVA